MRNHKMTEFHYDVSRLVLMNGNLITPWKIIRGGYICLARGVISEIGLASEYNRHQNDVLLNMDHRWITPGFIDLLVHGAVGYDVMDATDEAFDMLAQDRLKSGTTAFLASTRAAAPEDTFRTLSSLAQWRKTKREGARILGVNLEGTFLGPGQKGAQPAEYVVNALECERSIYLKEFDKYSDLIKIVMVAPELPEACEFIRELRQRQFIVSVGHSAANYEQTIAAFLAGASHVVHTYNAMKGITTRQIGDPTTEINELPGVLGAALSEDSVTTEVIADGIHVHPALIKILLRCKGTRGVVVVTDNVRGCGMPDGWTYNIRGQDIVIKNGVSRLRSGMLAGCITRMNVLVQNMVQMAGLPITEAVQCATINPARVIGLAQQKGSLAVGMHADLTVLDETYSVVMTIIDGQIVWRNEDNKHDL